MSFTLNVMFRGLHALVPSEPVRYCRTAGGSSEKEQRIRRFRILTVDARREGSVKVHVDDEERVVPVCPHDPYIAVEQPEGPDRVLALGGHWIELDTGAEPDGVFVRPSLGDNAELAAAVVDEVATDPKLMASGPSDGDPRVAGSFRLAAGVVSGCCKPGVLRDFRNPRRSYRALLNREVRVEVPVPGDRALLRLVPFGGGGEEAVELAPRPGRYALDVTFSNLCAEPDSEIARADVDFGLYYDLLDGYTGPRYVPHPVFPRGEVAGLATRIACDTALMPAR